jgi:hypothetical protein
MVEPADTTIVVLADTAAQFSYEGLRAEDALWLKNKTQAIREIGQRHVKDIILIGDELLEVQQKLGRGQFGRWLAAEFGMTGRTAYNYMAAAEFARDKIEMISQLEPSSWARGTPPPSASKAAPR